MQANISQAGLYRISCRLLSPAAPLRQCGRMQKSTVSLPEQVDTVIVGGGVIGASVAYHLSKKNNIGSILLLEQAKFTSGTTWHAAGLVGCLRNTGAETQLSKVGQTLYQELEAETGLSSGFKRCGSVSMARTPERMLSFESVVARCRAYNVPYQRLTPEEVLEKFTNPLSAETLVSSDKILGGLWLPLDGSASPTDLTLSLMEGAKQRGVTMVEGACVQEFSIDAVPPGKHSPAHRRVAGVSGTVGGNSFSVAANRVILTAGQWSRQLAEQIDVNVPLHSAEHYYLITKQIPGVWKDMPVARDPDAYLYFREWSEGLCVGGFEPNATPIWTDGAPQNFEFSLLEDNWDGFMPIFEGALERVPALADAEVRTFVNGPESFTLDNQYILGEAPEVSGFFVAAGFNSSGIASAGGAGAALADWVALGHPPCDLSALDIRRFGRWAGDIRGQKWKHFLRDRTGETLGLHYAMPWPRRELQEARGLRMSPLHEVLESKGACFGQKFGWERVNFFADAAKGEKAEMSYTYGSDMPGYWPCVERECLQTRNSCSLFDMTSFGKHIITGSVEVLDFACTSDIKNAEIGKVIYTQMLNGDGGIEADVTVVKLAEDRFMVVSATAAATRNADWIRRTAGMLDAQETSTAVGPIRIQDVTDDYAVLALMGPRSRDILSTLTGDMDFWSEKAFPFGTFKDVHLNGVSELRAQRVSYVGELGWELFVDFASAVTLHDKLFAVAELLEATSSVKPVLALGGYYAVESLRLEKGYRAWGHDIGPDDSIYESGLSFTVNNKEKSFMGKDAVQRRRENAQTRLVQFRVEIDENYENGRWKSKDLTIPWGGESIYLHEGGQQVMVGYCLSSNISFTLQESVHMGFVKHADIFTKGFLKSAQFSIEINGKIYPAKASFRPSFDPQGRKMKGISDNSADDPVFEIKACRCS